MNQILDWSLHNLNSRESEFISLEVIQKSPLKIH